jgi:hypothetical protein
MILDVGRIRITGFIDCGLCGTTDGFHRIESKDEAAKLARSCGWAESGRAGWVCPKCALELAVAKSKTKALDNGPEGA